MKSIWIVIAGTVTVMSAVMAARQEAYIGVVLYSALSAVWGAIWHYFIIEEAAIVAAEKVCETIAESFDEEDEGEAKGNGSAV